MTQDIVVTIYNHYGDLIGRMSLGAAIEIHGISNESRVYHSLINHGTAIGVSREGYVRLEKE
jgi:hypothetical protein